MAFELKKQLVLCVWGDGLYILFTHVTYLQFSPELCVLPVSNVFQSMYMNPA